MQQRRFPPWGEFVSEYWEKQPLTFRDSDSGLCDEQAVFDGLRCAAQEFRTGTIRDHRDVSFHLADAVVVDPGKYLPRASDSLETYLARLEASVDGQPFTLLINNFHEFSTDLCVRMRLVARNVFEHLGWLCAGMVSSHLMLARYAVSPFAVHKDPNSVFTFMIRGKKTLRVWPFEAFAHRTQRPFARHRQLNLYDFDYRPFQDTGIPLIGEPGDVLYWPSTYWHVGETDNESIHISLHLTFDLHSEPRGEAVDLLQKIVEDSLSEADWHSGYAIPSLFDSGPVKPPDPLILALRDLTTTLQSTIEDLVKVSWLSRTSAQGFLTLSRPSPDAAFTAIDATCTTLQADPIFPMYWDVSGDTVTLAAHGQVVRFPTRSWTPAFLAALSGRRPFRIADLAPPSMKVGDEIVAVASKLLAIGALHARAESCSTNESSRNSSVSIGSAQPS